MHRYPFLNKTRKIYLFWTPVTAVGAPVYTQVGLRVFTAIAIGRATPEALVSTIAIDAPASGTASRLRVSCPRTPEL